MFSFLRLGVAGVAIAVLHAAGAPGASAQMPVQKELTVVSWGGSYTRSQMLAYVKPFRSRIGEWVKMERYNGGLDEIREQVETENVEWDVVDFELSDLIRGCREGLLEKINHGALAAGRDGTPVAEDFMPGALTECGVGQMVWATVVAYDGSQIEGDRPSTLADFFDRRKFPGKRGPAARPAGGHGMGADGGRRCPGRRLRDPGDRRGATARVLDAGPDPERHRLVVRRFGAGPAAGFRRGGHDLRLERAHVRPDGRGGQGLRHRLGRTALGHRLLGRSPRGPPTSPRRWTSSRSPRAREGLRSRRSTSPTARRGRPRWPWWMRTRRPCSRLRPRTWRTPSRRTPGGGRPHHEELSAKFEQWLAKGGRGPSGTAR